MTPAVWQRNIARLIALFPQREISRETIAAYWELLCDLDDSVFERAVALCGQTCTFFPSVKELRDAAATALDAHQQLPPMPERAWEDVLAVARYWSDVGSLRHALRHELEHAAIERVGGVMRLALADEYEARAIRQEFLSAYTALRHRTIDSRHLLRQPLTSADDAALEVELSELPALRG